MNERFVCVKVDREERPDVDAIYMDALQAMTGHGGWPLNAFLRPDGVPFYAGTYFPPQPRQGMPSWRAGARGRRAARGASSARRSSRRRRRRSCRGWQAPPRSRRPTARSTARSLDDAVTTLRRAYDAEHGGWGGAPKFPQASTIEFLLRRGEREMALHTLRRMAARRHVRPGRRRLRALQRRRPLDRPALREDALRQRAARPRVPARVAGHRRAAVRARRHARRSTGRCASCARTEGGFASRARRRLRGRRGQVLRLDARRGARRAARGPRAGRDRSTSACLPGGNFEGANIPVRATPDPERLGEIKAGLLAARERRVRPGLDDKRLTAWNALMISALAEAGAVLERARLPRRRGRRRRVRRCATCATATAACCAPTTGAGRSSHAYLEDHAFLLEALLTLYEATFDARWFAAGARARGRDPRALRRPRARRLLRRRRRPRALIARRKELEDAPIPSGGSAATFGLLRLGRADRRGALRGRRGVGDRAAARDRAAAPDRVRPPAAGDRLPARARARRSRSSGADTAALERVVREEFRPHVVLAGGGGRRPAARGPRARSTAAPRRTSASASPVSVR